MLSWLKWRYKGGRDCVVEGSDGLAIEYRYDAEGHLLAVGPEKGEKTRYEYDEFGRLTHFEQPDGSIVSLEYPTDGLTVSVAGELLASYHFGADLTEVRNAEGGKTVYRHSNGRLLAKEEYALANAPMRTMRYVWSKEGKLTASALLNESGEALSSKAFDYDSSGNCIRETLHGNLTGKGPKTFALDPSGHPTSAHVESYRIDYAFDALNRCIEKKDSSGLVTTCAYAGDTDLVQTQWLSDGSGVRLRQVYTYDSAGRITERAIDDGRGQDFSDIADVTRRQIVTTTYLGSRPLLIDEKYWDRSKNEDIIQKTTLNQYDSQGRLVEKQSIDGAGVCHQMTRFAYDALGRVTTASDNGEAVRQFRYDSCGRLIQARDSSKKAGFQSTYDLRGRLVATDVTDAKKRTFHQSHRYDAAGNRVATIDIYGNETLYSYDPLGRQIRVEYPANAEGVHPVLEYVYDLFDRVIQVKDPNGYTTEIEYNVRGSPTRIRYPDETSEVFEYSLDGSLRRRVARNGVETLLERDCLSRVVRATVAAEPGESCVVNAAYDPFGLISVTDPLGHSTRFEHDDAGRVCAKVIDWSSGSARTEMSYDAQNHIVESKQWFGHEPDAFTTAQIERDATGNAVGIKVTDAMQRELVSESYLRPETWETPAGYHVEEDFSHRNSQGQRVLRKEVTDEAGSKVTTIYDALGHVVSTETRDSFGVLRTCELFRYDLAGNLLEERRQALQNSKVVGEGLTTYTYGPGGRLESVTRDGYVTKYEYDASGNLSSVLKPNGVTLTYSYDSLGRISKLRSSNYGIDYSYRYDALNRPVEVIDHKRQQKVTRSYHPLGGVDYEDFGGGLAISKSFDRQGRTNQLVLPDGSAIVYTRDSTRLVEVERLSPTGESLYIHRYDRFDDSGRPTKATQPADAGTVSFTWDEAGRAKEIASKGWTQKIDERDAKGNILRGRVWDLVGKYNINYTYDQAGQVATERGACNQNYIYDGFGNLQEGFSKHEYDRCGNVAVREVRGTKQYLYYDALDRLSKVIVFSKEDVTSSVTIIFTYDAFNRRLSKIVMPSQERTRTLRYLYDGDTEIGAVDEQGNIVELRVLGTGISGDVGAAVAMELDGELFAPIHDSRGCVVSLTSAQGIPVECYRYTAFGQEQCLGPNGELKAAAEVLSPWRFSSKRTDEETGLVYFGQRYYDPDAGRWLTPDPLGNIDGANPYLFVRNNPVSLVDPQGLFSVPDLWDGAVSTVSYYLRQLGSYGDFVADIFDRRSNIFDEMLDNFQFVTQELIGPTLYMLAGLRGEVVEFGVFGNGEVSDKVRISFVNGVLNGRESVLEAVNMISQTHGGTNIHYTFRPTAGWTGDILYGLMTLVGYTSPTARRLAEGWNQLINEMGGVGGGGTIIHYAHSLGGAETLCASALMTPEQLKMIRIITFGSAKVLPQEGFQHVKQYISWLDGVMMFDPFGYFNAITSANSPLTLLGHKGILLVDDHTFCGPIYAGMMAELGQRFIAQYEGVEQDRPCCSMTKGIWSVTESNR